jgi:hypothetical protein
MEARKTQRKNNKTVFKKGAKIINVSIMATKGKTRGLKENKYVKKTENQDADFATKRKRQAKKVGTDKK